LRVGFLLRRGNSLPTAFFVPYCQRLAAIFIVRLGGATSRFPIPVTNLVQ